MIVNTHLEESKETRDEIDINLSSDFKKVKQNINLILSKYK